MKQILLVGCILLSGCASKSIMQTVFLKETNRRFTNLEGQSCKQSGFEVIHGEDGKHYDLITYYSNCAIHETRQLEEFEVPQWRNVIGAIK